jgi:YidC/Oxa1 family membrane protein insertase
MNKRMILTFALCASVMIVFQIFVFSPQQAKREKQVKEYKAKVLLANKEKARIAQEAVQKKAQKAIEDRKNGKKPNLEALPDEKPEEIDEVNANIKVNHAIKISTKEFDAVFSTQGASLQELTLKNIDNNDHTAKLRLLHTYTPEVLSLGLSMDDLPFSLKDVEWNYEVKNGLHIFWRDLGEGRRIEKIIEGTDNYHFNIKLRFSNNGKKDWQPSYTLNGPAGILEEYTVRAEELQGVSAKKDPNGGLLFENVGVSGIRDAEGHRRDFLAVGDGRTTSTKLMFTGINTKYFASLIIPMGDDTHAKVLMGRLQSMVAAAGMKPTEAMEESAGKTKEPSEELINQVVAQIVSRNFKVTPKQTLEHEYLMFCGPKSTELVYAKPYVDHGVYKLRDYGFGFFATPARILAGLLAFFHSLVGNYGIAILMITFLVRAMLHPLTRKSQMSMHKMQKLGPEIKKIKDKYEGKTSQEAKQKMTTETMALYSKNGVNPVAGCLPVFIQMPVFFALYNVLNYTYELRHAKFFFWITDLSQADHLFTLPFMIPFHATNVFSVLPVVMLFLYLANQKVTPKPTDPKQAETQKIMKFMLPMFAFLFYSVPSGLLLYFITSMSVGIGEQFYIKRLLKNMDLKPAPPSAPVSILKHKKQKKKTKKS